MSALNAIRTSLEVGFPEGKLPPAFECYRGRATRAIPVLQEFPFEDAQFEVVLLAPSSVTRAVVKEAHRVLRPDGRMFFTVNEKTSRQDGFTMPEVYALIRDGFNIVAVERPPWWRFGRSGRTLTISATKKNWRTYKGLSAKGALPFGGFQERS